MPGDAILASDGDGVPDAAKLVALEAGTAASPLVADGVVGPEDLAVARSPPTMPPSSWAATATCSGAASAPSS